MQKKDSYYRNQIQTIPTSKRNEEKLDYLKQVLSWSIADILNPNLLGSKLSPLPAAFNYDKDGMTYNEFFTPLILEETRAVLAQSVALSLALSKQVELVETDISYNCDDPCKLKFK